MSVDENKVEIMPGDHESTLMNKAASVPVYAFSIIIRGGGNMRGSWFQGLQSKALSSNFRLSLVDLRICGVLPFF